MKNEKQAREQIETLKRLAAVKELILTVHQEVETETAKLKDAQARLVGLLKSERELTLAAKLPRIRNRKGPKQAPIPPESGNRSRKASKAPKTGSQGLPEAKGQGDEGQGRVFVGGKEVKQ